MMVSVSRGEWSVSIGGSLSLLIVNSFPTFDGEYVYVKIVITYIYIILIIHICIGSKIKKKDNLSPHVAKDFKFCVIMMVSIDLRVYLAFDDLWGGGGVKLIFIHKFMIIPLFNCTVYINTILTPCFFFSFQPSNTHLIILYSIFLIKYFSLFFYIKHFNRN